MMLKKLEEFDQCLLKLEECGSFVLIGGQAVNFWAERYKELDHELEKLMPFTSRDCDIYVSPETWRHLKATYTGAGLIAGSSPVDGQLGILTLGESLKIDFIDRVFRLRQIQMGVMTIREIDATDWKAYREVRLKALQDSPYAFGATFEEESQHPDSFWLDVTSRWSHDENTCFLLCEDSQQQILGMAGCYGSNEKEERAIVYSVWLHKSIRGGDTASALLSHLAKWSKHRGMTSLEGYVTENNPRARAFYRKLGFVETDERVPLSWDRSIEEVLIFLDLRYYE